MNKKAKVGIPVAILTVIAGVAGGSYAIDFSTTNIGQIGDNTINNIIRQELGIDLNEFKNLCNAGTVHEEFQQYCALIP